MTRALDQSINRSTDWNGWARGVAWGGLGILNPHTHTTDARRRAPQGRLMPRRQRSLLLLLLQSLPLSSPRSTLHCRCPSAPASSPARTAAAHHRPLALALFRRFRHDGRIDSKSEAEAMDRAASRPTSSQKCLWRCGWTCLESVGCMPAWASRHKLRARWKTDRVAEFSNVSDKRRHDRHTISHTQSSQNEPQPTHPLSWRLSTRFLNSCRPLEQGAWCASFASTRDPPARVAGGP